MITLTQEQWDRIVSALPKLRELKAEKEILKSDRVAFEKAYNPNMLKGDLTAIVDTYLKKPVELDPVIKNPIKTGGLK